MNNEEWYDAEIARELMALSQRCQERGMAFIATVEYAPGKRGLTYFVPDSAGLEMRMVHLCARTAPNIDSYVIGLQRHCAERGIDTGGSIVMRRFET